MKNYCVDTNAIMDLCYRYYPKKQFNQVWQFLIQAVVARQIKLYITEHIYQEVQAKISQFNYEKQYFDEFLDELHINIIPFQDYDYKLTKLKADMATVNPNLVKNNALSNKDQDLSNICVMIGKGQVITSEQGFNIKLDNPSFPKNFKIPDVGNYFQVECHNWLPVFEYIGFCE